MLDDNKYRKHDNMTVTVLLEQLLKTILYNLKLLKFILINQ